MLSKDRKSQEDEICHFREVLSLHSARPGSASKKGSHQGEHPPQQLDSMGRDQDSEAREWARLPPLDQRAQAGYSWIKAHLTHTPKGFDTVLHSVEFRWVLNRETSLQELMLSKEVSSPSQKPAVITLLTQVPLKRSLLLTPVILLRGGVRKRGWWWEDIALSPPQQESVSTIQGTDKIMYVPELREEEGVCQLLWAKLAYWFF